jgi:Bacterial proteasome activator
MGTDTNIAVDQPTMTVPTPNPLRNKVMRIATMTKQLLEEVHAQPLDAASLDRLRTIDTQIIGELLTVLTPDLREELRRLALPITRHTELSDAELRLAHAQLVGWLQGLLKTTHTALSDPHAVPPTSQSLSKPQEPVPRPAM